MLFIAHRGESLDAPENTLAAFTLAWERNCRCIECDIHMTLDGEIICMHDASTARTTGVNLVIAETLYEKLWPLDAGGWKGETWLGEPIPKLSEVLSEMPADGRILIEIKSSIEILDQLKKIINNAPVSKWQIRIIAFDEEIAARAKVVIPGIRVYLLKSFEETVNGLKPDAEALIATLKKLKVDGVDAHAHTDLTADYVRKVKQAGFKFHVWTVDDEDEARRFIDYDVSSITSNRAARLSKILNN